MNAPVVDCSVTIAWVLGDESSAAADSALESVRIHGGTAPGLWWVEVRNVLLVAERRGRSTPEDTSVALRAVDALDVRLDATPDGSTLLRLARTHRLTAYDAMYLELAIRRQRPLATLDHSLAAAALVEGVVLTI